MSGIRLNPCAETTVETLTCLFFSDDTPVSLALQRPLAPAAAVVLCLVADGDARGLSRTDVQFALRFAFDHEEALQVADAGFAAAIEAGLAILRGGQASDPVERLYLTDSGQRMADNLQNVLKPA